MTPQNLLVLAALLVLIACKNETADETPQEEQPTPITHICQHCDTSAVMLVAMDVEEPTSDELLRFLCSFDESCAWDNVPFRATGASFQEISYELFILHMAHSFDTVQALLAEHTDLNVNYLLKLIDQDSGGDLPYPMIVDQYRALEELSPLQSQFYAAVKNVQP